MLTKELSRLQNELKLPEIEDQDLSDLTADPESLKIRFSAVRLSRNNDAEAAFRNMLLHVEHDLLDEAYIDQPMAFPVFGRGRVLYALVGDGLMPELIEEACQFLTGACQCTVKAENPGVDLLMQVDWDNFIQPMDVPDTALPPLAGFTGFGEISRTHQRHSSDGRERSTSASFREHHHPGRGKPSTSIDTCVRRGCGRFSDQ